MDWLRASPGEIVGGDIVVAIESPEEVRRLKQMKERTTERVCDPSNYPKRVLEGQFNNMRVDT